MKQGVKQVGVSRETLLEARGIYQSNSKELEEYIDYLLDWNSKINLVSRAVSRETIREHIVHSLIPAAMRLTQKHKVWIDSGTGGGLPGVPLAICENDREWILNDNVKKKIKAVSDIVQSLELENVEIAAESISLFKLEKGMGIVTKHAFKIEDLLRLLGGKPWKTILMWKGVEGALGELNSSKKKLNATVYRFEFGADETFYEGKGVVVIER